MKKLIIIGVFITTLVLNITAAETQIPTYDIGSQMFTFRAGPIIPSFIYMPNQDPNLLTYSDTGLKVGGYGAIRYQGFLSPYVALGGELGYIFNYARSDLYTSVPFLAKLTYIPLQGKFELPLSFGVGFAYNSFRDSSYLSLIGEAEIGLSYFFSDSWGVSISGGLSVVPEIYFGSNADQTAIAGFLPITLSISYRSNK